MKKIVNEFLINNFTKTDDKFNSLGVGKPKLIKEWLEKYIIIDYEILEDLSITVNGDVYLTSFKINNFPSYIQFATIIGDFRLTNNDFTSLKGCPKKVMGDFSCSFNNLSSLEYGPEIVSREYFCKNNPINTLEYLPLKCKYLDMGRNILLSKDYLDKMTKNVEYPLYTSYE